MSARPATAAPSKTKSKSSSKPLDPAQLAARHTQQLTELNNTILQLQHINIQHTYKLQSNQQLIQSQNNTINVLKLELKQSDDKLNSIYNDMTRQYKSNSDEYQSKINHNESIQLQLQNELNELHDIHRNELDVKQNEIDRLQCEINQQKSRMNDMVGQFSCMLKQTLNKMNEKIVLSNQHVIGSDNNQTGDKVMSYADYSLVGTSHQFKYQTQNDTVDQYQLHS